MTNRPRLRRGQIVAVEFDDHCQGGADPIRFVVYGELAEVTRSHLKIDSWAYADRRAAHDPNESRFTLVRAAVRRVTVLVPNNS